MAAREFIKWDVVDATEADVEAAIEATDKGVGLVVFALGRQICFLSYANT